MYQHVLSFSLVSFSCFCFRFIFVVSLICFVKTIGTPLSFFPCNNLHNFVGFIFFVLLFFPVNFFSSFPLKFWLRQQLCICSHFLKLPRSRCSNKPLWFVLWTLVWLFYYYSLPELSSHLFIMRAIWLFLHSDICLFILFFFVNSGLVHLEYFDVSVLLIYLYTYCENVSTNVVWYFISNTVYL